MIYFNNCNFSKVPIIDYDITRVKQVTRRHHRILDRIQTLELLEELHEDHGAVSATQSPAFEIRCVGPRRNWWILWELGQKKNPLQSHKKMDIRPPSTVNLDFIPSFASFPMPTYVDANN